MEVTGDSPAEASWMPSMSAAEAVATIMVRLIAVATNRENTFFIFVLLPVHGTYVLFAFPLYIQISSYRRETWKAPFYGGANLYLNIPKWNGILNPMHIS